MGDVMVAIFGNVTTFRAKVKYKQYFVSKENVVDFQN
jgi:hypothetical protein